ncbi:MAG: diacylglycerol kinase family lipid kinase [Pyrinomonadaceae bacterium]|nr:diacylglycerol kinase family lipid kinase [Pyrinomonadaceae bacterium]
MLCGLDVMQKEKTILIYNPNAGRGGARREREVSQFCSYLEERGLTVEAWKTRAPLDATELAQRAAAEGAKQVVVSGGDGTINEALQGLIGTDVDLGIWARGTANVLARELKLPFGVREAAERVARGLTGTIYIGCATVEETGERRYFFLMAGIGLDASVVQHTRPRLKRRIGKGAFWFSGLSHLASWKPVEFEIEVEGQTFPATFAAVGKSSRYGGDLAITPRARLEQPEFEICLINSHSRLRYLHLLSYAMREGGIQSSRPDIRYIRATRARATGQALVQVDGEILGTLPMTFEIAPSPINVIK